MRNSLPYSVINYVLCCSIYLLQMHWTCTVYLFNR